MGFKDPTSVGDILSPQERPNGEEAYCRDCGAPGMWHTTRIGRRVFLEPRPVPASKIPHGKRWGVLENGVAVTLGQSGLGHCRITHFDVCPSRPAPRGGLLLALWEKHRDALAEAEGGE